MPIAKNQIVELHYKLQEGNEKGELVESTYDSQPLKFIFGIGQMIPAFELNLEDKSQGDSFAFGIKAENAYGTYDDQAVANLPIQQFEQEGKIDPKAIEIGRALALHDQEGNQYRGVIKAVENEIVTVDFNHPMAGVDLYFSGEIVTVREATESELDHGHVHE